MTEESGGGAGDGKAGDDGNAGPDRIRSIAVHREDVANALEATLRSDREVVLRVTPPYSGRMRARLHALDADGDGERNEGAPPPVHVDPRDLVADVPPYPEVDDTAAAYPDADLETRRKRHAEAVEAWRERVRDRLVSRIELDADGTPHAVDVTVLG